MLFILLNLMVLVVSCLAYQLKFDLNIQEGNVRFVENIQTDLQKNTVRYDVPAHNNVYETHRLQDFKLGLQITCFPALQHCRLRKMEGRIVPDAGHLTESLVHSWNIGSNSISSDDSVLVREYYYLDKEVTETGVLGKELTDFYKSFELPLYKEVKVPEDAVMLNMTQPQGFRRIKRQLQTMSNDCLGKPFKTVYGVDSGASCNYMKICKETEQINGQWVFTDCGNVHITSPLVYRCQCCPTAENVSLDSNQCTCSKMG